MIDCIIVDNIIFIKFEENKRVRERVFGKVEDAERFIIYHLDSTNNLIILNKLFGRK